MTIKKCLVSLCLSIGLSVASVSAHANNSVGCNWGLLTKMAIEAGFPQGEHASDPSGDGRGNGRDDADQPRSGLANVVNQGDLQALCEFIKAELGS